MEPYWCGQAIDNTNNDNGNNYEFNEIDRRKNVSIKLMLDDKPTAAVTIKKERRIEFFVWSFNFWIWKKKNDKKTQMWIKIINNYLYAPFDP